LLAAAATLACATTAHADPGTVTLVLRNEGASTIRCTLILGHWVTRDVPVLAPGAAATIAMKRQPEDGALYLLRADGRRRMMVETLLCGDDARWWETRAEIALQPLRAGAARLEAACRMVERLDCTTRAVP
jgi:hypothetical protein